MSFCPNCFGNTPGLSYACPTCGYRVEQRDARTLGLGVRLHNRYIVGRVLGVGGFGITYAVYDTQENIRRAVKEYFPNEWAVRDSQNKTLSPSTEKNSSFFYHGREIFVNEANILHMLQNDPNVVSVKDYFEENGTAYIVMEFLEGLTLKGYLKYYNLPYMGINMADDIICKVGMSLHNVHKKKLLHRDVGPDNIMMLSNGDIRLIDFGATRVYALNSPKSMSVIVKDGFAPIEQYSKTGRQGPWTDVYALAATYYFLVSGKKPPGAPELLTGSKIPELRQLNPALSDQKNKAISRALAINHKNRTQTVKKFLADMGLIAQSSSTVMTDSGWTDKNSDSGLSPNKGYILMQIGQNYRQRFSIDASRAYTIGRSKSTGCDIYLNEKDNQISGIHCAVQYIAKTNTYQIMCNSKNFLYTSRATLARGQGIELTRGDWFFIQTSIERYIFYLE